MFSENHSIWSYFYLRKISCHKPQDVKKGTNNRNFYTDIYPIFPQVLSYYVRVFDVCGALQYFNVLSPPPPLLLLLLRLMSGYRDIVVTAGTVPASNVRSWVRGRDDRDRILFPVKWQPWVLGPDILNAAPALGLVLGLRQTIFSAVWLSLFNAV